LSLLKNQKNPTTTSHRLAVCSPFGLGRIFCSHFPLVAYSSISHQRNTLVENEILTTTMASTVKISQRNFAMLGSPQGATPILVRNKNHTDNSIFQSSEMKNSNY